MAETTPLGRLIESRRSIRKYLPQPVEREKIEACLEAARLAPSAQNAQSWRFIIIDNPGLKARFTEKAFSGIYAPTRFAAEAPALVLILAKIDFVTHRAGQSVQGIPFYALDVGIAGEHLVLQAEELGLGTCWIGWFDVRKTRRFFKIPRRYKIVSLISLGYAARRPPHERVRKSLEGIAWWNRFDG
ncbi:MAG: nitroreductase family protein [Candidatus Aminicenantes bacterium]|nr:nitroreductase family protein [Candidatus Aminicenantes bacterium]